MTEQPLRREEEKQEEEIRGHPAEGDIYSDNHHLSREFNSFSYCLSLAVFLFLLLSSEEVKYVHESTEESN